VTDLLITIAAIVIAYLLGSIPFGFVVARTRGIDIRSVGSGNIGATNVFRSVGKSWGILTFVCDFLKGLIPALLFSPLATQSGFGGSSTLLSVLCGVAAIVGHNWPIFLRFKGGKGVATSAGALIGICPAAVAIGIITWIITFLTLRYVSLASMIAAMAIAVAAWIMRPSQASGGLLIPVALTLLALLVIGRHHANIGRLIAGRESRFNFKKKSKGTS